MSREFKLNPVNSTVQDESEECSRCAAFIAERDAPECPEHGLPVTSGVPRFLSPPDWDTLSPSTQEHLLWVRMIIECRSGKVNHAGLFGRFEEIEKLLELAQSSIENRIGVEGSATQSCVQSLTQAVEALEQVLHGVSIGLSSKLEATNDKIVDLQGEVIRLQKAQNKVLLYLISQLGVGANIDPLASTEEQANGIEEEVDDLSEIFG